jgi:hypothetical protein
MGYAYIVALCADEFGGNGPKRDNFLRVNQSLPIFDVLTKT